MDSQFWQKKAPSKKREAPRRVLDVEDFDSNDHWVRDCRVRAEAWFSIESWARDHGFHMVAYKSKKRLYQKGMAPDSFVTFLEVRHEEGRVVLKSWIEVSRKMRWLTLFHLAKELKIDPNGFWGIRVRRKACHEMNDLLMRLRQPEIAGTQHAHWADLDITTLGLLGVLTFPLVLFCLRLLGKVEIATGLSNNLLTLFGEKLLWIGGVGISFVLTHHFIAVKQVGKQWIKNTSFGISSSVFMALCVFLFTRTGSEMRDHKIVHHCISHLNEKKCGKYFNELSVAERSHFSKKLQEFQKHLAIKSE